MWHLRFLKVCQMLSWRTKNWLYSINYRPISILPTVGKVLERIIHDQLYNYLTVNNLLISRQSGFRKGYSTGTCIVDLLHNIYEMVDGGGACGVLFLDLSKAFDTVDHSVVRTKFKALGIKESSISWFASSDRVQCTCVYGVLSDTEHTGSGVPQGSILGPLLFVCYIKDMPKYCNKLRPFIYADNTALLTSGNDLNSIQNT